ncbi:MAG: hypothetical protein F6K30_02700 [Cyanothece sp. SIO2G6]|nr:hypothetical protein [Cyanothece sp. SIO2G6]
MLPLPESRAEIPVITPITNAKLSSLQPVTWADFRGFTLLFDNPGSSFMIRGNLAYVAVDATVPFYQKLGEALKQLNPDALLRDHLFCALPPHSYHVTACDGGNVDNCAQVTVSHRQTLENFLAGLPDSLQQETAFSDCVNQSELSQNQAWQLNLAFDHLANWSGVSLVACLKPADDATRDRLQHFIAKRRKLCTTLHTTFGINPPEIFVPHITLGYFGNREAGQRAQLYQTVWQDLFANAMQDVTLRFNTMSLYGFTDMATFFKGC